jgi:hypothetical protein
LLALLFLLQSVAQQPAVAPGAINGFITDRTGAAIFGAQITLSHPGNSATQTTPGTDGHFSLSNVTPGFFELTIVAQGFTSRSVSGTLQAGQKLDLPPTTLQVAQLRTDVEVTLTSSELAKEELKTEEKQRLVGIFPNYLVTYDPHPIPLTVKQKFGLSWKSTIDPTNFIITGMIAGVEQYQNDFSGFGQGTEGYAKRYGANYADFFLGSMIGGAVLPTVFKQDPRYIYEGAGTKSFRFWYALSRAVVRQGDNGHLQPNYSDILGGLITGGISNLYYPAKNRNGASLTFENTFIGLGANALTNVFQEFASRKLTPKSKP